MGDGPAGDSRCVAGAVSVAEGNVFLLQPVHHSTECGELSRPAALRSRTIYAGAEGGAIEVRLLPFRRGRKAMHRRIVRVDGDDTGAGDAGAALAVAMGSRTKAGSATEN